MAIKTITDFRSKLTGGGARPNLFEVNLGNFGGDGITGDWNTNIEQEFRFMCKAAQIPASTIASIDIPFRGRTLKVAGDRTIENWTVTVINDEDFKLRNAFEAWMNGIARLSNNTGATKPQDYMTDAFVHQLGRGYSQGRFSGQNSQTAGNSSVIPLKSYKFVDIFPVAVSSIELSYDSSDTIEEFTVEFAVQTFESLSTDATGIALS